MPWVTLFFEFDNVGVVVDADRAELAKDVLAYEALAFLAMPHHGVLIAVMMLGEEEANGKNYGDYCAHNKAEDGHPILRKMLRWAGSTGSSQTIKATRVGIGCQ